MLLGRGGTKTRATAGRQKGQAWFSVAIVICLEGAITRHAQVLVPLLSQLHIQLSQVGFSYYFIQFLGQEVGPKARVLFFFLIIKIIKK